MKKLKQTKGNTIQHIFKKKSKTDLKRKKTKQKANKRGKKLIIMKKKTYLKKNDICPFFKL